MLQSSSAVGKGDPSNIGMIRRWANGIALTAAVSVAYFLAAQLSLRLLMQPDGVAVFWLSWRLSRPRPPSRAVSQMCGGCLREKH